jgi:hypothetical protein
MATNTYQRTDVTGTVTKHSRKGTQGRPRRFGKKYGQRLFTEDEEKIKQMGYEKNDFVRLATHKLVEDMANNGYTELVKT